MSVKESQAIDLLELIKGNDVDRKISELASVKAQVKHQAVQSEAINILFEACRIAIASPNSSLSGQALSFIGHLTRRVSIQEPARIRSQAHHVVPLLVEKLGDSKERNRSVAANTILETFKYAPQDVEKGLKEFGFSSKNQRVRLESTKLLQAIYAANPGFSFKGFTPFLMNLLEDPNEGVRETAKEVVVDLFRNSPDHAKSDLKRELQKSGVRKGIANYIVSQLGIPENTSSALPQGGEEDVAPAASSARPAPAQSVSESVSTSTYMSSIPGNEMEDLEPIYVNTNRELEDIFDAMVGPFEGRESEHNWLVREQNAMKIRRMLRGNAYRDFQVTFLAKLKSLLDGILKTVNSLRTTLSTMGTQLVKDLAIVAGPGIDPLVEILLTNLVKQCANTKKITSQLGNLVVSTMLAHVSYHVKLLQHIYNSCQDKNVQPRSYAPGWITVILETHADHKSHIEHSGGVDVLVKCIKRGLADANPGVRENTRKVVWKFKSMWPEQANAIIEGLDASSRKLLEKTNPNATAVPKAVSGGGSISHRGPSTLGRSVTAPARPSIREAILAQKKSRTNLKTQLSTGDLAERQTSPPPPAGPSGLSSAPVRRPVMKVRQGPEKLHTDSAIMTGGFSRGVSPVSGRASPGLSSRLNGARSPPLSPPLSRVTRGVTPTRAQSPMVRGRKLTVLEQLNHPDWRVRIEGIVVVACILAKRTPPDYEGLKMPTLPPADVFAPTLVKLLNDPQSEVVEHVVAPEVLAEMAKVVPMDLIVPRVLLLSEGDDEQHAQHINTSTIPVLKQLMSDYDATELLFKVIQSMSASGVFTRKPASGSFTPAQKRKITHGCLRWMNELAEAYVNGEPNAFFGDRSNYKLLLNRFIQMLNTTKAQNYTMLAALLRNLQNIDSETFNKTLATFEATTARELKRAWGHSEEEETEDIVVEEKVADVEQVLGSVPAVGGSVPGPARSRTPSAESVPRSIMLPQDLEDIKNSPPLAQSPVRENPIIKVYQDPITESDTGVVLELSAISDGKESQNYGVGKFIRTGTNLTKNDGPPKNPGENARTLETLIRRIQSRDIDTQAFKKLTGIAKENPVREPLQEANGEDLYDIWQGGPVFEELLTSLLEYLKAEDIDPGRVHDLRAQALILLKQLVFKAAPYFVRHEAEVFSALISLRSKYPAQSQITTSVEAISEEYLLIAEPKAGIDAIVNLNLPLDNPSYKPSTQSLCTSLTFLADLVKTSRLPTLEPQLERLGELAIKALEEEDSEVRRSCMTMCIEMHSKLNDDERLFDEILKGMKSGHQNLLAYYFARRAGEPSQ